MTNVIFLVTESRSAFIYTASIWFANARLDKQTLLLYLITERRVFYYLGDKTATVGDNHEASLILSHDTPGLLEWASLNEKRLTGDGIDLLTVAERSTIQLVTAGGDRNDTDLTCPGFRLDF